MTQMKDMFLIVLKENKELKETIRKRNLMIKDNYIIPKADDPWEWVDVDGIAPRQVIFMKLKWREGK